MLAYILDLSAEDDGVVRLLRLNIPVRKPLFIGYRDVSLNLEVRLADGARFVVEYQLHIRAIVKHKEAAHKLHSGEEGGVQRACSCPSTLGCESRRALRYGVGEVRV